MPVGVRASARARCRSLVPYSAPSVPTRRPLALGRSAPFASRRPGGLSLIHISEPTRLALI
eukprot:2099591-Alexandrium_andersonii.AAC.1